MTKDQQVKENYQAEALEILDNIVGRFEVYLDMYNKRFPEGAADEEAQSEPVLISDIALLSQDVEALRYYIERL